MLLENRFVYLPKQFIKFCFVGGTSALINFFIYYSLINWLAVWYIYATIPAFILSAVFNFLANKFWTFQSKQRSFFTIKHQASKFILVISVGLLINISLIYGSVEWLSLDENFAWLLATGIVTFWNFTLNKSWTFSEPNKA